MDNQEHRISGKLLLFSIIYNLFTQSNHFQLNVGTQGSATIKEDVPTAARAQTEVVWFDVNENW